MPQRVIHLFEIVDIKDQKISGTFPLESGRFKHMLTKRKKSVSIQNIGQRVGFRLMAHIGSVTLDKQKEQRNKKYQRKNSQQELNLKMEQIVVCCLTQRISAHFKDINHSL